MKFEEFNDKWCEAFGARLTERNGASSWADFVEDDRRSDGLIVKVLGEFADDYAALVRDMSPHARNAIPTCRAFRERYFDHVKASRPAAPTSCPTCGGRGIVYALAPCKGDGDRQLAPEDWRTVSPERVIPFAEAYACPVCKARAYEGRDLLRRRLIENSVPEVVRADDPRNAYRVPVAGNTFIRWSLEDRFARAKPAAFDAADDELERKFPMEARA